MLRFFERNRRKEKKKQISLSIKKLLKNSNHFFNLQKHIQQKSTKNKSKIEIEIYFQK